MMGDVGTRVKSERKSEQNSMVTGYKSIEYESEKYPRGTSRKSDFQTSKKLIIYLLKEKHN